ncbi:MAG TPA: four helix bundle protein [Chloroflexota bacterium]|jgi:four helix bundle protein
MVDGRTKTSPFTFERLDVWVEAVDFADVVYRVTRGFPDQERFGPTSQLRRAAVSVSSNVAEGSSRASRQDFARFIEIATGSVFETVSQATIAHRQGLLSEGDCQLLRTKADHLGRMLSGLRKSLIQTHL